MSYPDDTERERALKNETPDDTMSLVPLAAILGVIVAGVVIFNYGFRGNQATTTAFKPTAPIERSTTGSGAVR